MGSGGSRFAPVAKAETVELKASFATADTDKDGVLSVQELQCLLRKVGADWPERRVEGLLRALDVNGDGKVKEDEVVHSLMELCKVMNAVVPVVEEKQKALQELPSPPYALVSGCVTAVSVIKTVLAQHL